MKGLVFDGIGKLRLSERLVLAEPVDDQVSIRVLASGLCQSDISVVKGSLPMPSPMVLGHEGAGVVEKVGPLVRDLQVGDHVILHTLASCGACAHCGIGRPSHCRQSLGKRRAPFSENGEPVWQFSSTSTFVERTLVKEYQAVRIDKSVPMEVACLLGCCVMTGIGGVLHRARPKPGQSTAVFGVGGVGLNVIQALRLVGCERIVAVDVRPERAEIARSFGATDFIDASKRDASAQIRDLLPEPGPFGSGGVDWAYECSGAPSALDEAMASLNWGGNVVLLGMPPAGHKMAIDPNALNTVDRGIIGVHYGAAQPHKDGPLFLDLYAQGKLKLDELVTQTYRLDQYEQALADFAAGKLARGVFLL